MDEIPLEQQSMITQYLMNSSSESGFWTRYNILLLAIAIEHILIALKDMIALSIRDVPQRVQKSEKNRQLFKRLAIDRINCIEQEMSIKSSCIDSNLSKSNKIRHINLQNLQKNSSV